MEKNNQERARKSQNFHVFRSAITSILIGFILIFLLIALLNEYSNQMIENQEATYTNIVRNISISIENEVNQAKQSLQFFVNTKDFNDALFTFTDEEKSWPLNQISLLFCVYYSQVIENMIISTNEHLDSSFWLLKHKSYEKVAPVSKNEFATVDIYLTNKDPQHAYLGITVSNEKGYFVTAMLDLELMYNRLISHINIAPGTDILVKNSNGLIVMSSNPHIIGRDANDVYRSLVEGKQGNPDEMLEIITNQLKRKEGSETFLGYWLYDTRDTPSKKLSVYVPALIDSGLLIISSIIDYDEVLRPVKAMYAKITVLVVAISLVFIGLIVYLHYTGIRKEETEKENRYLRELNRTLQLVNENQRVENHQQRLEIIGTMTCGIAHEFNNLLTPIMGYSGMLLSKIDEHDKEWEDIKEIYDASEKAKEIIQQISAFGRKNSDMTFHHISVQHFFKQLQKLATGLMSNTINFICIPPEQEYYIFGNATQLTQVVLNMIVNAIDAIGKQEGEITLSFHLDPSLKELPAVETSEGKLNMYACIQVTDTGCGMDKSTQKQIFNPFFTTKGNQGGHGLGLLISKNIVTTHHGKILSTSELQKGSTFTIRLPLSKKPSKSPKKTTISSLQEKKPIVWDILIVNEDPIALRQIAKSLSKRVYLVTKLHNSLDALTQLNQHSYTVLVVDDALTQITWGELSMKARQLRPSLTTVLLTNTISEEVINAVSTGILDGYLLKPSSGNELEEKILDVVKYKY